jgi:uncharacterized protein YbaR (Trm112 family)/SAM-dependent methyltransferase
MFYPLLDYIVCPHCRHFLTLLVPTEQQQHTTMRMRKAKRTSPKGAAVGPLPEKVTGTPLSYLLSPLAASPATDGRDRDVNVVQGILVCLHCEHWYPIRNGLPELLPDHLRNWDEDRNWLMAQQKDLALVGLERIWETLSSGTRPSEGMIQDEGAHYKKAEMTVAQRSLPEGFFTWGLTVPFLSLLPNFSIDLLARFVTAVSRLDCGINGMVLDLGVGFAWTTEWLVRLGYQAIGIDICRDYILAGLSRMGSNLPHLLVGDIENLPLRDECVEAVLSFDAFHHIPNRSRAIMEISRAMRGGTKMVFVEPGTAHEHAPLSVAVTKQHNILERGFDQENLTGYIKNTPLGNITHHRSDAHSYDIFTLQKSGVFELDSLTPRVLRAELFVQPQSGTIKVESKPELMVSIRNCGDTIWLNATSDGIGEVHLGANLFDANYTLLKENYARVVLPRPVRPGQRIELRCSLPPILQTGSYIVELDMVVEGLLWFKNYAFQPAMWPLTVTDDQLGREWGNPIVAEPSRRIVPTEVSFEPSPVDGIRPLKDGNSHPPFHQLLLQAWQVLKTDGPLALGRKSWTYLRRRPSTK